MTWLALTLLNPAFAGDPEMAPDDAPMTDEMPSDEEQLALPDRSHPPDVLAPEPLELDDLEKHSLGDGLDAYFVRVPRIRKVTIDVTMWQGRTDFSNEKESAHSLMGSTWAVASENYDSAALAEMKDVLDMSVWGWLDDHSSGAGLRIPLDDLDKGLDVLADVLKNPVFPGREIKIDKEDTRRYFEILGPASPARVAGSAMTYAWNPADHPYGYRPEPDVYAKVKRKEAVAVHQQVLGAGPATILVVGDMAWSDIEPKLKSRFAGLGKPGDRSEVLDAPMPTKDRVIAVAVPSAEQVTLRMRMPAPSRTDPRNAGMEAVGYALGGHFLARLNKNLREDKGWTYGVGSWYSAGRKRGSFNVSVDVPADKFAPAVTEIEKEIAAVVADGVTDDEIDAWWRAEVMEFNQVRGTIDSASRFYGGLLDQEESVSDALERIQRADEMTVERSVEVAKEILGDEAPRIWVVVGPKEAIEAGLTELDWEAEWVTPRQAILGQLDGGL